MKPKVTLKKKLLKTLPPKKDPIKEPPKKKEAATSSFNPVATHPIRIEIGYKFGNINGKIFEQYMFDHMIAKDKSYDECKKALEKDMLDFVRETCESIKYFFEEKKSTQ